MTNEPETCGRDSGDLAKEKFISGRGLTEEESRALQNKYGVIVPPTTPAPPRRTADSNASMMRSIVKEQSEEHSHLKPAHRAAAEKIGRFIFERELPDAIGAALLVVQCHFSRGMTDVFIKNKQFFMDIARHQSDIFSMFKEIFDSEQDKNSLMFIPEGCPEIPGPQTGRKQLEKVVETFCDDEKKERFFEDLYDHICTNSGNPLIKKLNMINHPIPVLMYLTSMNRCDLLKTTKRDDWETISSTFERNLRIFLDANPNPDQSTIEIFAREHSNEAARKRALVHGNIINLIRDHKGTAVISIGTNHIKDASRLHNQKPRPPFLEEDLEPTRRSLYVVEPFQCRGILERMSDFLPSRKPGVNPVIKSILDELSKYGIQY